MADIQWKTKEEMAQEWEKLAQKEAPLEERFDSLLDILMEGKLDKSKIKKLKEKK